MRVKVIEFRQLAPGQTHKFLFAEHGIEREGFLFLWEGKVMAYENLCRHIPISLDYDDNQFFTRDGKSLICQSHGATYDPATGLCVRGPCEGASLRRLETSIEVGFVWVTVGKPQREEKEPLL